MSGESEFHHQPEVTAATVDEINIASNLFPQLSPPTPPLVHSETPELLLLAASSDNSYSLRTHN